MIKESRVRGESSLFTIPETGSELFCFADFLEREEEFYYTFNDNNLTGLLFKEVEIVVLQLNTTN